MVNQFKPKVRNEAKQDFAAFLKKGMENSINQILNSNYLKFPYQTCIICRNFNENKEECKLFNAKPPARVIAFGCDKFDDLEEIPF